MAHPHHCLLTKKLQSR